MEAKELFEAGNALYVDECYESALKSYSMALEIDASHVPCYVNRAATHVKLGNFKDAVQDANDALSRDNSNRLAFLRKGTALFHLFQFEASRTAFQKAVALIDAELAKPGVSPDRQAGLEQEKRRYATWVRKCEAELAGSALPLRAVAATKAAAPAPAPTAAASASSSQAAAKPQQQQQQVKAESPKKAPETPAAPQPTAAPAAAAASSTSISGRPKIRHEWVQSSNAVTLTIYAKGVQQQDANAQFGERSVSVSLRLPGGGNETFDLEYEPLHSEIVPEKSTVRVSPVKVEVVMQKKQEGVQWPSLEHKDINVSVAKYPTSNAKQKDWSSVEKAVEAELKSDKPEGEEALNKLFREIYSNADENTRKAMVKSFQTSGGTVLSTNWDEVKKADYDDLKQRPAPDGQVWKKWDV